MSTLIVARYADFVTEPTSLGAESVARYRVLRGNGDWVLLADDTGDGAEVAAALAGTALSCETFREVFRSPDARPVADSAEYVYLVRIDVEEALVADGEFARWYNEKHIPDVAAAGLLRGRRFENGYEAWQFLASYDMANADVLETQELARIRGFEHFTPFVRGIERTVLQRA